VAAVAHALRGSAALIGLSDLAAVGAELEQAALAGELTRAQDLVARLPGTPAQERRRLFKRFTAR